MLFFYFLTLFFIPATLAGHIRSWDIKYLLNNKNNEGTFSFFFKLQTNIAKDDYLRIDLPFPLLNVNDEWWNLYEDCNDSLVTKKAKVVRSTIPGDAKGYFVSFYNDTSMNYLEALNSSQAYFIKFKGTPDSSSTTGVVGPVKLATVSNNAGNWITYDYNPVYGLIYLANDYSKLMPINITIDSFQIGRTDIGSTYPVQIDIQPTLAIHGNARIDIKMSNPLFTVANCKSIESISDGIPRFASAVFTSLAASAIRVSLSQSVDARKYRFICDVTNPNEPATGGIQVLTWYGNQETIVESGIRGTGFSVLTFVTTSYTWNEVNHKAELGWGYDASASSALPIFRLYKDRNSLQKWYQSTKIYFNPAQDMITSSVSLRVVIRTIADVAFTVLKNTFYTNLPQYDPNVPISCSTSIGNVTCTGVGDLSASTIYFVSFKFNIGSGVTTAISSTFGKVRLQTSTAVTLIDWSFKGIASTTITTNQDLFGSTNGRIAHSTRVSDSQAIPYIHAGEDITLNLEFKYFSSGIITKDTAENFQGIEFYTSRQLPSSTPTCSIATLTQGVDIDIDQCTVEQALTHTRLRFRIKQFVAVTAAVNTIFTPTASVGRIGFGPIQFPAGSMSSALQVNEFVYDFYARWVRGFLTPTPAITTLTPSQPFFFNTLVYTYNGLAGVNAAMSFFTTGNTVANPGNDGAQFPTLIRIAGALTPDEQAVANRLIIFFNDVEPIDTEHICFGTSDVTCKQGNGGISNTQTNDLVNYYGSKMVTIEMDFTTDFNIYIPVRTLPGKKSIGFFLATAAIADVVSTAQNIFQTTFSKRFAVQTYTNTNPVPDAANTGNPPTTPYIDTPGSPLIGSVANTNIKSTAAAFIINNAGDANTATEFGAGYGLCADYDFKNDDGFAMSAYNGVASAITAGCVGIDYTPSSGIPIHCAICPVHDAMTTGADILITAFTFPNHLGQDFGNFIFMSSVKSGNLKKAVINERANMLTPAELTDVKLDFYPINFKKNSKNHLVFLNFTTQILLPRKIQIELNPQTAGDLYFRPMIGSAGPPCECRTHSITSCVVSGDNTHLIITFESNLNWPVGEHMIAFYVDSSDPIITGDQSRDFLVEVLAEGIAGFVEHHKLAAAESFTVIDEESKPLSLSDFSYSFGNRQTNSRVEFTFIIPDDIAIAPQQKIRFNLGDIAMANIGFEPICYVMDPLTGLQSTIFKSCDSKVLTKLELSVKKEVVGSFKLVLPFVTVPSNSAPAGITAAVVAFDGVTRVSRSDPARPLFLSLAPKEALFPGVNLEIVRKYSDVGTVGEYTFKIRSARMKVELESYLYLYFPSYYSPNLGYDNLYCSANGFRVACFNTEPHLIRLTSFPAEVEIGELLEVNIYGIIVPDVTSDKLQRLFIALDDDADYSEVVEHGKIMDEIPDSTVPDPQLINEYEMSSSLIRVNTSHRIVIPTDSIGVRAESYIVLDFPSSYGNILHGGSGPLFYLYKDGLIEGDEEKIEIESIAWGSRFKMKLPIELDPYSYYHLEVNSLENVENVDCNLNRLSVLIADSSELFSYYRSAPQGWNAPKLPLEQDPDLKNLYWKRGDGSDVEFLELTSGVYSELLQIVPPTGERIQNDMVLEVLKEKFATQPSPIQIYGNRLKSEFRVAGSATAYPNLYSVDFLKTETAAFNEYSDLPRLNIIMINDPKTIVTRSLKIAVGGTSVPLLFDVTDMIPYEDLKLTAEFDIDSLVSINGISTINFSPVLAQATFSFFMSEAAVSGTQVFFTLKLAGENQASYQLSNDRIAVNVIDAPTDPAVISSVTIAEKRDEDDNLIYGSNKLDITVETDQPATFYWHIAYEDALKTSDCLEIKAKAESISYDSSDVVQAQYGAVYIQDEDTPTLSQIENLYSGTTYSVAGCAFNQLDAVTTDIYNSSFTTVDMGASVYKLNFEFSIPLNKLQIKTLCCIFKQELLLPNDHIVAEDGTTCEEATFIKSLSNTTHASFVIYIFGDKTVPEPTPLGTDLSQAVTDINARTSDTVYSRFRDSLTSVQAYSSWQSISSELAPAVPLPELDLTTTNTEVGSTWIKLSGPKLSSGPGIVYVAYNNDTKMSLPGSLQVIRGVNASLSPINQTSVWYDGSNVFDVNFTELQPDMNYMFYFTGRNRDVGPYFRVSAVQGRNFTTLPEIVAVFGERLRLVLTLSFSTVILTMLFS